MHEINTVNLYQNVWNSVLIGDGSGGYKFDHTFADGPDAKQWPDEITTQELVRGIAYWGNEQRPQVNHTKYINLSASEVFQMTIDGLWPYNEIQTKLWKSGTSEPTTWSSFPVRRYINIDGGYANVTPASTVAVSFTAGTYWLKFKVGNDSFGRFPIYVSGSAP
jgi:hypothetical protein